MSGLVFRRGLLAGLVAAGGAAGAAAQQAPKLQGFPSADAAAAALTAALRADDHKALAAMLGEWWRVFVPTRDREFGRDRDTYLAAWDERHKVMPDPAYATDEMDKPFCVRGGIFSCAGDLVAKRGVTAGSAARCLIPALPD